jgi:hypothetical protein
VTFRQGRRKQRKERKNSNLSKQKPTMNTSTTLTLNDRFSMMKSPLQMAPQPGRGRSRSRSRGRQQQQQIRPRGTDLRGSKRNQKLLTQLEKQHKMRLAMKLKNVSLRRQGN